MERWGRAFAALAIAGVVAVAPARANAGSRGFTPAMAGQFDRLGQAAVKAGRTPGLAIGAVEDGRLVYAHGFGFANLVKRFAVKPDTEFYAGAVTMQFTAGAILLLSQDGKLRLDDKVVKYVPELTGAYGAVTVEQLLAQTSGLPDLTGFPGIPADPSLPIKLTDVLAAAGKIEPAAPPGSVYANNALNYLTARLIVERASGLPFSDYLQQQIFLPLVMDRTFVAGDSGISPSHAVGYTRGSKGFVRTRSWDPSRLVGASGLVTTVYDLAKWDIEMPILLRVDAVREMFTSAATSGPTQYGLGWVIDQRGGKRFVWYAGEIAGYHAINAVLPDDHIAVIVLANADSAHGGGAALPEQIAGQMLDILAPPAFTNLDNAVVAQAKEWLVRLAARNIDRTELTASFSAYLTDDLVAREDFAALGKLQAIIPISSTTEPNGDILYEFLVRYPHARYHYKFALTRNGKIDEIALVN